MGGNFLGGVHVSFFKTHKGKKEVVEVIVEIERLRDIILDGENTAIQKTPPVDTKKAFWVDVSDEK